MVTLSIVLTALVLAILIGMPLGIWAARSDRVWSIMRPLLDGMQTIPAFVYLVPVVMLFGIGNVPGVIVTVIFAISPLIWLTNLGIRQVPEEVVEATRAFGATDRQLLWKAQIPLALPTIMAGVNQTLMMSLSMVVIASMISVGGLGQMVLRGIGRLDVGLAAVGGLGIVMLAIVLDRLTQALCSEAATGLDLGSGTHRPCARQVCRPRKRHAAEASRAASLKVLQGATANKETSDETVEPCGRGCGPSRRGPARSPGTEARLERHHRGAVSDLHCFRWADGAWL